MPDRTVPRQLGFAAALATVVANIIGTGVFTTLGLQVQETTDGFALLALWAIGGLIALAGALCYGELSAAISGSGGEYRFLRRIYQPGIGTVAGWVSVAVGFAAPVALAAMALGLYAGPLLRIAPQVKESSTPWARAGIPNRMGMKQIPLFMAIPSNPP